MSRYRLIVSAETLIELGTVISRPKFDRYLPLSDRLEFFGLLRRQAIHISHIPPIIACRDPKDDKFLALAVAGREIHPHGRRRPAYLWTIPRYPHPFASAIL